MPFLNRECRECGKSFKPVSRRSLFCGVPCKQTWNNRRQARGAELYDFVMHRQTGIVSRLADAYVTADKNLRAGRPSAQDLDVATMAVPAAFGANGDNR